MQAIESKAQPSSPEPTNASGTHRPGHYIRGLCAARDRPSNSGIELRRLAFHLEDSASFRAFARLPLAWSPKKSVLHQTICAIRPETWEAVNRALLASAQQDKLESGATVRIDSTVTAALMHAPSDSALLWDAVHVMSRLLRQAAGLPGAPHCSGAIAGAWPRSARERSNTAAVKTN